MAARNQETMKALKSIEKWLDGWNDHPSHIVTVVVIVLTLGALAVTYAVLAS